MFDFNRCAVFSAVFSLSCFAMAGAQQTLPDAPESHAGRNQPHPVVIPMEKKWWDAVEPGQRIGPLSDRQKLLFPLHEEANWTTAVPILFTAEYGVLTNNDPKYGTNGKAFAQRMGAEALYQGESRVLSDGILPVLFHQDPRYDRQAYGSYTSRALHAVRRVFIAQNDDGKEMFDYSGLLGRGMASALTETYYPARSVSTGVVFHSWAVSLASFAGGNAFFEFWPDVKARLLHMK